MISGGSLTGDRVPLTFAVWSHVIFGNRRPAEYVFHSTLGSPFLISKSAE